MSDAKHNEPTSDAVSLHVLVALAAGAMPVAQPGSWQALFSLAQRERVLGLTWRRSASVIRAAAPGEVVSLWQRHALILGLQAQRQLEQLASVVRALTNSGVAAVVLKGAPLGQRLYGDPSVRPTLDLDLYIPLDQRRDAARVLADAGWRVTSAQWPEEEKFERRVGDDTFVMEIHSSAIDDALLDHIRIPIEHTVIKVGPYELPAHSGAFLPVYLATHLLKHHEKPLLWVLDFAALWTSLDDAERREARQAAHSVGAIRHLEWAIRLVRGIGVVAAGSSGARRAYRFIQRALEPSSDLGRVAQLVALSSSPADACRVLGGRIWPSAWRQGWRNAPAYFTARAVAWAYRHLVFELPSASSGIPMSEGVLSLDEEDCASRLVAALDESQAVWVSCVGQNMAPAVPLFGLARVVSPSLREPKAGEVIAIRAGERQCALERVLRLTAEGVVVKPDAPMTREHSVPRAAILGVCDLVQVGSSRVPIERRPHDNAGMMRAIVRNRLGALSATLSER